ncbi:DUF3265 domain-containing protein [Vibrio parahaemolyticus]|nr:DUF3265 domain-containing protein [Vibrio parahaemolyticus]MCG7792541.1 DUF3265 domain-containing protein [Vibrio parahaemolyticus]MCZ6279452.1 DUF3265 domain-containing protein [Vibrio parahaemolyticus]MDF5242326.1 DUF3265 domain-containing protein [Vibrio parahaemolyticus]MDG3389424.1 DUF3265 domain-containing protein [Vibrio parahaemolyticus]MDS1997780.1 DUF3265 domain-containing protein [Vibrio parahaemolyticus]
MIRAVCGGIGIACLTP